MKLGDTITYQGVQYIVMDFRQQEDTEGNVLLIRAVDPDTATREHTEQIQKENDMEKTKNSVMNIIKRMSEGHL